MTQVTGIMLQSIRAMRENMELEQGGSVYKSTLEGYGDMSRTLLTMQETYKAIKKDIAGIVDMISCEDVQELKGRLGTMYVDVQRTAITAIRMAAAVDMTMDTVTRLGGGDILSMMEDVQNE